jgi:hypothetical protein
MCSTKKARKKVYYSSPYKKTAGDEPPKVSEMVHSGYILG